MAPGSDSKTITDLVASHYAELTEGLQQAADYIVQNPIEAATTSLRSIAASSGLSPTTFSRLARALGVENHDAIRRICRESLTPSSTKFSDKVQQLQSNADGSSGLSALFYHQVQKSIGNLEEMARSLDTARLERVVRTLSEASSVTLLASSTSRDLAKYLAETVSWISDRWHLVDEQEAAIARSVAHAGPGDAYVLISKSLFTSLPVRAAQHAAERGAFVLVITDLHSCPALPFASEFFVLPEESPHYFSSYAPTVVLFEAMTSMLAAQLGEAAEARIKDVEAVNRRLNIYWDDTRTIQSNNKTDLENGHHDNTKKKQTNKETGK